MEEEIKKKEGVRGTESPDGEKQMIKMVKLWWDGQDLDKNQSLFKPGGVYYDSKKDSLTNYWCYEIRKFINTDFMFMNNEGKIKNFKIKSLDSDRKRFLINELGKEINVKHFLELFDKFF